ncbi:MAG: rRNA maturation RNase YbeY [Verrucomicrobiota bacterium]|nr:rRNA maturation RNase YbeY [Verrucomicrobiota bacterium]
MNIHIFNNQKDLSLSKPAVRRLVQTVLQAEKASHTEVSIYFVTTRKITELHDEFFDDPTPTDCISFPLGDEHLGEVFVCPATATAYAKKKKLNPYDETALYIVHGLLHCLGYDDLESKDRRIMRKKEKTCMALLKEQKVSLHGP